MKEAISPISPIDAFTNPMRESPLGNRLPNKDAFMYKVTITGGPTTTTWTFQSRRGSGSVLESLAYEHGLNHIMSLDCGMIYVASTSNKQTAINFANALDLAGDPHEATIGNVTHAQVKEDPQAHASGFQRATNKRSRRNW